MEISESFAQELAAIGWFRSVGQLLTVDIPFSVIPVASWEEAIASCIDISSDKSWENRTLEARGDLTEFLFLHYRERDRQWNDITMAAMARIINPLMEQVWQPFAQQHELEPKFLDSVAWDVLAAIMEHEYQDCIGRPVFFLHLLEVYRAGHFPCGWQGEWDASGRLMVY